MTLPSQCSCRRRPVASAATANLEHQPSKLDQPSSATLNGSINPNGSSTSWYFEYGTSTNYSSRTATRTQGRARAP
jgi:hypothetical protein